MSESKWTEHYEVTRDAPDLAAVAEELIRIDANLSGQQRDDAMADLIIAARAALSRAKGETT